MAHWRRHFITMASAAAVLAAGAPVAQARGGGAFAHGVSSRGPAIDRGGAARLWQRGDFGRGGRNNALASTRAYYPSAPFGPFTTPYFPSGNVAPNDAAPQPIWTHPPYVGSPPFGEPGYQAHPVIYHIEDAHQRSGRSVRHRRADTKPWPMVTPYRF